MAEEGTQRPLTVETMNANPRVFNPENYRDNLSQTSSSAITSDVAGALTAIQNTLGQGFQMLAMSLGTMTNTLGKIGAPAYAAAAPGFTSMLQGQGYMPTGGGGTFSGGMDMNTSSYFANATTSQLLFGQKPFNVNPNTYAMHRNQALGADYASMALAGGGAVSSFMGGIYGGNMVAGIGKALTGSSMGILGKALRSPMTMMLPVGMAVDALVGTTVDNAEEFMHDTNMFRQVGGVATTSGMGWGGASNLSHGIRDMTKRELRGSLSSPLLGLEGNRELMTMGMQSGLFKGESSSELLHQATEGAKTVKLLAGILGSKDVKEAISALAQFRQMGMDLTKGGTGMLRDLGTLGSMTGMGTTGMLEMATGGSAMLPGYGMAQANGIMPFATNYAIATELNKRNALTTAERSVAGGSEGIAGGMNQLLGGLSKSPGFGQLLTGMGMTAEGFDMSTFNKNMKGSSGDGYFGVVGSAASNMFQDPFNFYSMDVNQTDALDQLSQGGNLEQALYALVKKSINMMPVKMDPNRGLKANVNLVASFVKQLARSEMGMDLPDATAKTVAYKIIQGENAGNVKNKMGMANTQQQFYKDMDSGSVLGGIQRTAGALGRVPERVSMWFRGAGDWLGDKVGGAFSSADLGESYQGSQLSGRQLINSMGAEGGIGDQFERATDADRNMAFNRIKGGLGLDLGETPSNMGARNSPGGRVGINSISSRTNVDLAMHSVARATRDQYSSLMGDDMDLRDFSKNYSSNVTARDIDRIISRRTSMFSNDNLDASANVAYDMGVHDIGKKAYDKKLYDQIYNSKVGGRVSDYIKGNQASILDDFGIKSAKDYDTVGAFSKNFYDKGDLRKKYSNALGLNSDEDYANFVQQVTANAYTGGGGLLDPDKHVGATQLNMLGGAGSATQNAQVLLRQKGYGISQQTREDKIADGKGRVKMHSAVFKDAGWTSGNISKWLESGKMSKEDYDEVTNFYHAARNGDNAGMSKALYMMKNPGLKDWLAKRQAEDPEALERDIERIQQSQTGSAGDLMQGVIADYRSESLSAIGDNIGFKANGKEFTDLVNSGDAKGIIEGLKGVDNFSAKQVVAQLTPFANGKATLEEKKALLRKFNYQGSADMKDGDLNTFVKSLTDETINKIATTGTTAVISQEAYDDAKENARNGKDIKDTIVEGRDGSAIRVIVEEKVNFLSDRELENLKTKSDASNMNTPIDGRRPISAADQNMLQRHTLSTGNSAMDYLNGIKGNIGRYGGGGSVGAVPNF